MKTVQITLDEALLQQVDEVVQNKGTNRSAYIREILEEALKRYRIAQLEKKHREGYERLPIQPEEIEELELWESAQVWPDDEAW
ncbi:MAG TPA: ribbon-helix-helix protein, CopG family [Anaerolineae bacterium]|nr:ribbon-helix-helix protein, CopG family [Anaerolineae bacterium]